MKKVYVSGLYRQEILDKHVLDIQDYVEQAIKTFAIGFMNTGNGVLLGLNPSILGSQSIAISSGVIVENGIYGELASSTGVVLSFPSSGTRTDLLVASYEEVFTDYASGFVLLDPATRVEQVITIPGSKTGQIKFEQLTNVNKSNIPSNKIPICEVVLNSSSITSLLDIRTYANLNKTVTAATSFSNLFYGLM